MAKIVFYSVTQAQYDTLVSNGQIIETSLYFISDTHKLYKGSHSYTGGGELVINTIGAGEEFPLTGNDGQIYTKPSVHETRIWKSNSWVELTLPITTSITSSSTDAQCPSAKAVYTAIDNSIKKLQLTRPNYNNAAHLVIQTGQELDFSDFTTVIDTENVAVDRAKVLGYDGAVLMPCPAEGFGGVFSVMPILIDLSAVPKQSILRYKWTSAAGDSDWCVTFFPVSTEAFVPQIVV